MNDKNSRLFESGAKEKVNIKEIRKKFENLSADENNFKTQKNLSSEIPTPPIRKYKNRSCDTETKFVNQNSGLPNTFRKNKIVSVKERSKIFEVGTNDTENEEKVAKRFSSNLTQIKNNSNDVLMSKDRSPANKNCDVAPNPPTKPPRSFLHSDMLTQTPNQEITRNGTVKSILKRTVISREAEFCTGSVMNFPTSSDKTDFIKDPKSRTSSTVNSNFKIDKLETVKSPSLMVAPNISTQNEIPKSQKQNMSLKSPCIKNCLKNISTAANSICHKMKQSGIFVDLTPTTVSPPKHYDTLKRSHSEEHIYAEPAEVIKNQSQKSQLSTENNQPLHYMCTPLIKPKLPDKNPRGNKLSREYVRTMIYDSFAPLRLVPKENQDSKDINSDSTEADSKAIQARIIYVKSIRQVSGSSICLAPKLFEALFFINVSENQPEVSYSFPLKIPETVKYPLLPHMCFPTDQLFKSTPTYQSETFYFTLFDKEEKVWGYSLRIRGWPDKESNNQSLCVKLPVAICILSSFNAPIFYKRLLFEIEKHLTLPRAKSFKYIRSLQKLGVPNAGASVSIPDYTECNEDDRVVIARPFDSHVVGFELTRALQLLDVNLLVKAVSSLLLERRVLLISSSVSNLYNCCQAISSLLYPFEWPHVFVPVLPSCLTVHCCSELPYIIGVPSTNYDSLLELLAEHELLILDVDKGVAIKSCNDEDTILPRKVQRAVISALNLAKNMTDPTEMLRDIMISEAFVHMYVEMIGHYENHFVDRSETLTFQKDGFLKNAISNSIQTFLLWFSETQMFDTFINESIWRINYRKICQTDVRTFFEKRVDEYKWELSHDGEKFSRFMEKTRNFGGKLISKLKK